LEIAYGLASASLDSALAWFTRLTTSSLIVMLPLDAEAAVVAGRVRAAHPTPPTNGGRRGSKPEQRAGWMLDIQIASCAWAHGYAIATDNRRDFEAIRSSLAVLYPTVPPLEVLSSPRL
jgi:predicted nucleic acid-binding protein